MGSGKTTLIERISKNLKLKPFFELSDPMIEGMLSHFYKDRKRWAFTLQILFLTARYEQIKIATEIEKAVLDRSIFGDIIFAKMLHHTGDMKDHELAVYKRLYNSLIENVSPPKLMIYIKISTDLAIERIKKRARDYELIVEREYWERLNSEYEEYFSRYTLSPLLVINADRFDWVANENDEKTIMKRIHEILEMVRNRGADRHAIFEI